MKKILLPAILILLLLVSCQRGEESATSEGQGTTAPIVSSPTPTMERSVAFTELSDEVSARLSSSMDYAPADIGMVLPVGGQALTGQPGKARLDLTPDGTIVRLGPGSEFTLRELNSAPQNWLTSLSLAAGQLWIILNGGELQVETEVGTASVRGSFMGILYDPRMQIMTATCLEGTCSLGNAFGTTELTDTQAADILSPDAGPSPARSMSEDEYRLWLENNPEAQGLSAPKIYGLAPAGGVPSADPASAWLAGTTPWQVAYSDALADTELCSGGSAFLDPAADIIAVNVFDHATGYLSVDVIVDAYSESAYYVYVTFYWATAPSTFVDYLADITPGTVSLIKQTVPGTPIAYGPGETFSTGLNASGDRVFRFGVQKLATGIYSLVVSLFHNLPDQACDHVEISLP